MSGAFLRVKFAIIMADTVDILTRWFSSSLPPLPSHPPLAGFFVGRYLSDPFKNQIFIPKKSKTNDSIKNRNRCALRRRVRQVEAQVKTKSNTISKQKKIKKKNISSHQE